MYLSQLLLDPASRRVQSELSNRYELHRTLTDNSQQTSPVRSTYFIVLKSLNRRCINQSPCWFKPRLNRTGQSWQGQVC